jgi:14-3-3 protein epsilon
MNTYNRDENVFIAKLSDEAERYEDMVEAVNRLAKMDLELTPEERNLFSMAYKNLVGARRASWRVIASFQRKEQERKDESHLNIINKFCPKMEEELTAICKSVLQIVENHLIKNATTSESKVFYHKMKGDYYRYMAEFTTGDALSTYTNAGLKAYEEALLIAKASLPPTHPIRLGLALNFSVFYYEIFSQPDTACNLAKQAFEEAIAQLEVLTDDSYKESAVIMQLLRDNLNLWCMGEEEEEEENDLVS